MGNPLKNTSGDSATYLREERKEGAEYTVLVICSGNGGGAAHLSPVFTSLNWRPGNRVCWDSITAASEMSSWQTGSQEVCGDNIQDLQMRAIRLPTEYKWKRHT